MKWYEYLFKPVAVVYRGVSYVLNSAFNFVGDTFCGGSRVVKGASVAVSDICGDVANVTNGIGNAVNSVGSNLPLYLLGGAGVFITLMVCMRSGGGEEQAQETPPATASAAPALAPNTSDSGGNNQAPTRLAIEEEI